MKVALAFLPKVKLNKILACFILSLCLVLFLFFVLFCLLFFVFYFFHLFYLYDFYFIYLFSFLLKRFIVLKDSISPMLTLQGTSLRGYTHSKNACQKKFGPLSLQPEELYYILPVFVC